MTIEETFDRMRKAMEAAGYPVILDRGKTTQGAYWPRAVIAYFLYADRWTDRRIAALMACDRSTITAARYRVQAALELPSMYDDVNEIIDKLKTQYHELFGQYL